jgi:hypothetical protein
MIGNSKPAAYEGVPTEKSGSAISSDVCEHRLPGSSLAHPDQMYLAAASINTTSDPKIMPNLPLEIFDNIFFFCTCGTLFNCLTLSQDYIGIAIMQLYRSVPARYYRNVTTDGKLVLDCRQPAVFQAPPNPSSEQALRLAHYRYAVRDIDDTLCGWVDRMPEFAKIAEDHPRIRSFRWRQPFQKCSYLLERNVDGTWTNLCLDVADPGAILSHRGDKYLHRLTKETGAGVSSLVFLDRGYPDGDYEDHFGNDMTSSDVFFAFLDIVRPFTKELHTLHIKREDYAEYDHSIEPIAKLLPSTMVNLSLELRTPQDIERILRCTLPNLETLTFSLDFPDNWAYTSGSGASDEASPNPKQAVMLVAGREDWGREDWDREPVPPSAMDTGSWLADILPFRCDLTVKHDCEAMGCGRFSPHPWLQRWMVDVEKIYRFHRTTMGKERLNEVRKERAESYITQAGRRQCDTIRHYEQSRTGKYH